MVNPDNTHDIKHIAFIMDGNGRWAKKRGMPREFGHSAGVKAFKVIARYCAEVGIDYITFFAFSTENWSRPKKEVDEIMRLFKEYLSSAVSEMKDDDINLRFWGSRDVFDDKTREKMAEVEKTLSGKKATMNIAINYGGRAEIVDAVNKLLKSGKTIVTEDDITNASYSAGSPAPDIIVRTGGEERISNFMIWQGIYSEYFFLKKLWPDIKKTDIDDIIKEYNKRNRRFGDVK